MTGEGGKDPFSSASKEPRHIYNRVMREVASEENRRRSHRRRHRSQRNIKVDWAVSLENGFVPTNHFPAKYRFDIASENCTGDYVVFGLTIAAGTQANLVGINNLYTEANPKCNGGTPFVAFAYNTITHGGGEIRTSPTISADGKKVAFVESTNGGSYFHVLVLPSPLPSPPSSIGTVLAPQSPSSCANPTTANCMSTTAVFGGANTASYHGSTTTQTSLTLGPTMANFTRFSPVSAEELPRLYPTQIGLFGVGFGYQQSSDRSDCR